jgi:uncharacterized membrane protein
VPNLHPILVHFTIGLFVISIVFDILSHFTNRRTLEHAGWWNLVFAAAFSVITVASGLSAEDGVPHAGGAHDLLELHETLGLITMGIILLLAIWRGLTRGELPRKFRSIYLAMGIAGLSTITTGGFFGGELVYRFGIGVAPVTEQLKKYEMEENESGKNIAVGKFYCPMDPEILSDTAGTCPKCGMNLVQKTSENSDNRGSKHGNDDD